MKAPPTTILFTDSNVRLVYRDIAKACGVSPSTITRWKEDPKLIPLGNLQTLCRIRKLSDEEILSIVRSR